MRRYMEVHAERLWRHGAQPAREQPIAMALRGKSSGLLDYGLRATTRVECHPLERTWRHAVESGRTSRGFPGQGER
jgi:hypothetical protein